MTIKKLKSIDIINVLSDLVSKKLETTVKLPPFGDNIERAHKSGVKYVGEPGGSIRDDHVIDTCDKYDMVLAFTHQRLFHH